MCDTTETKPAKSAEELRLLKKKCDEEKRKKRDKNYMSIIYDYVR